MTQPQLELEAVWAPEVVWALEVVSVPVVASARALGRPRNRQDKFRRHEGNTNRSVLHIPPTPCSQQSDSALAWALSVLEWALAVLVSVELVLVSLALELV